MGTENLNPLSNIIIKYAQIISGQYKITNSAISPVYVPCNSGPLYNMLKVRFERDLTASYYITDPIYRSKDYQHTVTDDQTSFFFPIDDNYHLNNLVICSKKGENIIGQSISIKNAITLTQKLINIAGYKHALFALKENLITLPDIERLPVKEIKLMLQKYGLRKSDLCQHCIFGNPAPTQIKNQPLEILADASQDGQTPDAFLCLITQEIMKKPVICTLDGKTYEESVIRQWLTEHKTSPYNRSPIKEDQSVDEVLIRNRNLEEAIQHFHNNNTEAKHTPEKRICCTII